MIKVFWAVLKDLWDFLLGREESQIIYQLPETPIKRVSLATDIKDRAQTRDTLITDINSKAGQSYGEKAYVKQDRAVCLSEPRTKFDTKLGTLEYGDEVLITRTTEVYSQVQTPSVHGWVKSAYLTTNIKEILPDFRSGFVYDEDSVQTQKLRRYINDEALGSILGLPVQPSEFVLYMIKLKQMNVEWPSERPRVSGTWQTLLKGKPGIMISLEPRTSSILEYSIDGKNGYVGYVEAVHPDFSITLQGFGRLKEGEYLIEKLTREEWKEMGPVYISFE